jgi:hypothetical protein
MFLPGPGREQACAQNVRAGVHGAGTVLALARDPQTVGRPRERGARPGWHDAPDTSERSDA